MTTALDTDLPMIGSNVIWYHGGNVGPEGMVGTVTDISAHGGLTLVLTPKFGGMMQGSNGHKTNVFHVDSIEAKEKPEMVRGNGVWDTLRAHEKRRRERLELRRKQIADRQRPLDVRTVEEKLHDRIKVLAHEGKTPAQICAIVGKKKDYVEAVIKTMVHIAASELEPATT